MRKNIIVSMVLVLLDQLVKLFILYYFMNVDIILIPGFLYFCPVQNTNLSWVASLSNYNTPVFLMIIIQIFGLALILFIYRYILFIWDEKKYLINGMIYFYIAGIICSFIDVMFWGGSLDFVRLFDWFTFDFKDVYLTIATIYMIIYYSIYYFKVYRKLSKEERKQTGLLFWIKNGMRRHGK